MGANYNVENIQVQNEHAQQNNATAYRIAQEIFSHHLTQAAADTRAYFQAPRNITSKKFVDTVDQDLDLISQNSSAHGHPERASDYLTIEPIYNNPREDLVKMREVNGPNWTGIIPVPAEVVPPAPTWSYQPWNNESWNSQPWNEQVCPPGYRVPPNYVYGQYGEMQSRNYYNQPNYDSYQNDGYNGSFYLPPPMGQFYAAPIYRIPVYQPPIERCGGFYVNRQPEFNSDKNWWERTLAHTAVDLLWRR